jgi:hypothetical protein
MMELVNAQHVVAWTPYGREETVSLLVEYIRREHERGIVDEWWLCLNTDPHQVRDVEYAHELAARYPWIRLVDRPAGVPVLHPKQRNTGYFYREMTDPDTVFVRLDDDIIYVHEDAIQRLVAHRLQAETGVASFPVMWNNSIISWYAQAAGVIPAAGSVTTLNQAGYPIENEDRYLEPGCWDYTWPQVGGPYCMDPVGWADGRFGAMLHRLLLGWLEDGTPERAFLYQDYQLPVGMQFSVSTFASLGRTYAGLDTPGVLVPDEEESWHTIHQPMKIGQPNVIVGNALVSHYTFFPQGPIIRATDILDRYRLQAKRLT